MSGSILQNMAERTQRSLMATLVLSAAGAAIYLLGVEPGLESLSRAEKELDALTGRRDVTMRDVRGSKELRERLEKLKEERRPYEEGLLKPVLESYAMGAKAMLDPIAVASGVVVSDYTEMPQRLLPLPKQRAKQLYARKPVKVALTGSYAAVASFVMRVEKLLPLAAVQSFSIKTVQGDRDRLAAEVVLEWPVPGAKAQPPPAKKAGAKK